MTSPGNRRDIRIRAARPSDKRAIRRICGQIWDDDYLPGVFDAWVRDRRGRLWVALIDGRVVGVAKLSLVGDREAWLHALRVDPEYQRHGVAGALLAHRIARARRLGARVARLDTADGNVPVRKLMRRMDFGVVGRYTLFLGRARVTEPPRRAPRGYVDRLWRRFGRTSVLMNERFVRRRVAMADLATATRAGAALIDGDPPTALAIVTPYKDRLRVPYLAGSGRSVRALLGALRGEAKRSGKRSVAIRLRSDHWRAARAAGYRRMWDDAMLVYEKRL